MEAARHVSRFKLLRLWGRIGDAPKSDFEFRAREHDSWGLNLLRHLKRFWPKSGAAQVDRLRTSLPVPPVHLRKRVHGTEDKDSFEDIGRIVSNTVFSYVKINNDVERF